MSNTITLELCLRKNVLSKCDKGSRRGLTGTDSLDLVLTTTFPSGFWKSTANLLFCCILHLCVCLRTSRQRLSVCGCVGSVCPLLVVSGTSFFCFSLTDDVHTLPVLVKVGDVIWCHVTVIIDCWLRTLVIITLTDQPTIVFVPLQDPSKLWWAQCLCVGQHVCVTALRVCVLQGWRGKSILCVTDSSEMHSEHSHTFDTHDDSETDTPASLTMSHIPQDDGADENQPDAVNDQPAVKTKRSKVINYQVNCSFRLADTHCPA